MENGPFSGAKGSLREPFFGCGVTFRQIDFALNA